MEKLLERFKAENDIREWLNKPFNCCERTIATNAYSLIAVPLIEGYGEAPEKSANYIKDMLSNANEGESATFKTQALKDVVDVWRMEDIAKTADCEACDGDGVVTYEFYYDHKTYDLDEDCPVCEGEGYIEDSSVIEGQKPKDGTVKLHKCNFKIQRIMDLLYVLTELGVDEFTTRTISLTQPTSVTLNDVTVILIPTWGGEEYNAEIQPLKTF